MDAQFSSQKLTIDGDDSCTNPNDNKYYGEDDRGVVVSFHAEHNSQGHANKERAPQVPVAQLGTHFALNFFEVGVKSQNTIQSEYDVQMFSRL